MKYLPAIVCLFSFTFCSLSGCSGFLPMQESCRQKIVLKATTSGRRDFVAAMMIMPLVHPSSSLVVAAKDDEVLDIRSRIFNAEVGTLYPEATAKARFRTIELLWDDHPIGGFPVAIDGINNDGTDKGNDFSLTYQLPEKWDDRYVDAAGVKYCNRITVYQKTGTGSIDKLDKAASFGIARTLDIGDRIGSGLQGLKKADLISSHSTSKEDGQQYFEFDLGLAPDTCESSQTEDDLSICPYDSIYLVSATVLSKRLFVCVIQCDHSQWKKAGGDLRRVRSSFQVRQLDS